MQHPDRVGMLHVLCAAIGDWRAMSLDGIMPLHDQRMNRREYQLQSFRLR